MFLLCTKSGRILWTTTQRTATQEGPGPEKKNNKKQKNENDCLAGYITVYIVGDGTMASNLREKKRPPAENHFQQQRDGEMVVMKEKVRLGAVQVECSQNKQTKKFKTCQHMSITVFRAKRLTKSSRRC